MKKVCKLAASTIIVSSLFTGMTFGEEVALDKDNTVGINIDISNESNKSLELHSNIKLGDFLRTLVSIDKRSTDKNLSDNYIYEYFNHQGTIGTDVNFNSFVSKGQAATIIAEYLMLDEVEQDDLYKEALSLENWKGNTESIYMVYSEGIMSTDLCNRFSPDTLLSVKDTIDIVDRIIDKSKRLRVNEDSKSKLVAYNTLRKTFGEKQVLFDTVQVDMTNNTISGKIALMDNQIGRVGDLKDVSEKNSALVGINGTYFNIYSEDNSNYGLLVKNGNVIHNNGKEGLAFGFDGDGDMDISVVDTEIILKSDDIVLSPIRIKNGYINSSCFHDDTHNTIYTPEFGLDNKVKSGTNVVVRDNKIIRITTEDMLVPQDGFIYNFVDKEKDKLFEVLPVEINSRLSYDIKIKPKNGLVRFWDNVSGAIGGMELLVNNSQIVSKPTKDDNSNMADFSIPRSAIGYTIDNQLIMVSSAAATLKEMSIILEEMGCDKAMSIGVGLGSSMYYQGKDLDNNRKVSSSLLIVEE